MRHTPVPLPIGYDCQITPDGIQVHGPYREELIVEFRRLEGRWNPKEKEWVLPMHQVEALAKVLRCAAPDPSETEGALAILNTVTLPAGYFSEVSHKGIFIRGDKAAQLNCEFQKYPGWWDNEKEGWRFDHEYTLVLADMFRRIPDLVTKASNILSGAPLPTDYICDVHSDGIYLKGPKLDWFRKGLRNMNGRWDVENQRWWLWLEQAESLAALLHKVCRHAVQHPL